MEVDREHHPAVRHEVSAELAHLGAPADERDRAISRRSLGAAYYVLIAGVILVGCVMPFQSAGWRLINAAVAAIVLAEVVRYGVAAYCYRRGFHG